MIRMTLYAQQKVMDKIKMIMHSIFIIKITQRCVKLLEVVKEMMMNREEINHQRI